MFSRDVSFESFNQFKIFNAAGKVMDNRIKVISACVLAASDLLFSVFFDNDDDEEEEDDVNYQNTVRFLLENGLHPRKREIPRTENYFEITVPQYSPSEFQSHFRMSLAAFNSLCDQIIPMLSTYTTGRPMKNRRKQILAVIWLLATPDSYR